jgi:hypothetical protein
MTPQLKYAQCFDVAYISDDIESAFTLNCNMNVMIVAHKLYLNHNSLIFQSDGTFMLPNS